MYIGFAVHHVARKVLVATTMMAFVSLATKTGRRIARVGLTTLVAATKAAASEMKTTSGH